MSPEPARVVVADPPWLFGDQLPGAGRGAVKHYPCLPLRNLVSLSLPPIASDAVLFLWRVSAMPSEALEVCKAWGFEPKSEIVWVKTKVNEPPDAIASRLAFGMGRQVRMCHESCIIATRGRCPPKSRSTRSVFFAPRARHSEKPEAFFDLVEGMHDGPYLELFARRIRPGWTCVGHDVGSALEVSP